MPVGLATPPLDASYVVALLLVVFYAGSRFKTPKAVRSQTSRIQFMLSAAAYVTSCTGVFMLLAWGIRQNSALVRALHFGAKETLGDDIGSLDAALVAALMMTTLLPNFPMLRDFDSSILRFFHRIGSIPFGALSWAQQMENHFTLLPSADAAMRDYILNTPQLPDMLVAELQTDPKTDRMRFRFTRNLAVYVAIYNLAGRARFADEYPEDVTGFEKRMCSYLAQVVSFLALAKKLSPQELAEVPDSVKKFRSLNLEAYEELRLMLARIMLYNCNNSGEIIARLSRIGFVLQRPTPIVVPLNLLSLDMAAVIGLFALATLMSSDQMPLGKAIAIGLLVSLNHSIAAVFALLPKQMWSFADIRCAHERPYLGYMVSALIALTISLPASYASYRLRLYLSPESGPILPFLAQCKWLVLSTTLAFALAFACDDHVAAGQEPRWLRWVETAGIAVLMGVVGLLVVRWLAVDQQALHSGTQVPSLGVPVMLSVAIGALFGATIPHWYRQTAQRAAAAGVSTRPAHVPAADVETTE